MDYGALEALFGEPVTTSVTGSPQRASEVPASMIIVTADEIRRSGARDIPVILRHVPGVDVLQWTNDDADVAVRGYNQAYSPRLLVMVDGRQVYADDYGYTPWSTLPVELADIRQIEIVKGPTSALFGFNAVGGVINIITYDPLYDDVNTASVAGGTQNLIQGSAVVTHRWGDVGGLRISLGARGNDDFSTLQRPVDIVTRRGDHRRAIDVLGHVRLSPDVNASLELSHSEAAQPEYAPTYAGLYGDYRTSSLKTHLSADTGVGLIQATAYFNWLSHTAIPPVSTLFVYHLKNRVYVAQLQDIVKPAPAHTLRISAEYRHNDLEVVPFGGAHVFYDVLSGGVMWSWAIQPDLSLTNAIRVDHLSLGRNGAFPLAVSMVNADWGKVSRTELSFNSGIVWEPSPHDTLRLTAARGVQLPNLLELGGLFIVTPFGYVGGIPTIKPAVVTNYELDWDRNIPDWHMHIGVRAYHQTTKDILSLVGGSLPSAGLISTPTNIGKSEATGIEFSLRGTFDEHWRWGLSYTPEVITDHFRPGFNAATVLIDYANTYPTHVVNANLGWASGPWEIDGYLRYQSRFEGIEGMSLVYIAGTLVQIPDYVSVDARIAYRITDHLTLAVSGQNLLQSPQTQTSAAAVERRLLFTVTGTL